MKSAMKKMKRASALILLSALALPGAAVWGGESPGQHSASATAGAPAKSDDSGFEVSGTTQGNTSCVILEKHTPVKGKLLLAGVIYARTEYRVIQSFNYTMPKQKYTGLGEIKELNQLAARDKIKLVALPSKYTPDQLEKARGVCRE